MSSLLHINKFNPRILEEKRRSGSFPTILVLGKRNTGKSTLVADLMYYIRKISMMIAMSGTEDGNHFYRQYIHPLNIYGDYKPDVVSALIKQQKNKFKTCDQQGIPFEKHPELGVGLLIDDCGYKGRNIMKSENISLIFQNGRHWQICFIVSLQYMMGLPPEARTNIDYVFALRENIVANQKKLYDNFFGIFPTFKQFQDTFTECTNNYECMVLDNTSKSNKLSECVFWYKATPNREYKIGSPELWNYLNSRYDPDRDDGDDDIDNMNKKRSNITVRKGPMAEIKQNNNNAHRRDNHDIDRPRRAPIQM